MSFINEWGPTIWTGFLETLTMTSITLVISVILGIPLGVLVVNSSDQGLHPNKSLYTVVNWLVNIFRSLPFIILLFLILPLTKIIAGTTIGIRGVILPLVLYCVPYLARLVESSILEVDSGIIEAYQSMGISNGKIIVNVVLREARSGLVRGLTITTIGLVGATAMAGLVGAGGLGDIAYQYGFQRYQPSVMYATIVVLIVLVQIVQTVGDICAKKLQRD